MITYTNFNLAQKITLVSVDCYFILRWKVAIIDSCVPVTMIIAFLVAIPVTML